MTITQFMSAPENFAYVNAATDAADKQKRIAELKKKYDESSFSSEDKADFLAPERVETALFDIKRLVARSGVQDSVKRFLAQRNEVIRRNKQRKEEAQKTFGNR